MGIESVFIKQSIIPLLDEYYYKLQKYENDICYNTYFITNREIYPTLQNDISLTIDSSFMYFDNYTNKTYEISFNKYQVMFEYEKHLLESGSAIIRNVDFINPPFNKNFINDPSFNINNYNDQHELYYIYEDLLDTELLIYKKAYYMIDYIDVHKTKKKNPTDLSNNVNVNPTDLSNNVNVNSTDLSNNVNVNSTDLYYNYYHMNIYCNVYAYNDDKLKYENTLLKSQMFYKDNIDISFISSNNFYSNCYDLIKIDIKNNLENIKNNNKLLKYLDICLSLIDV